MLLVLWGYSQDKRFTLSVGTELADKNTHNDKFDYGFNIATQIEYQMTLLYFNAEVYWFPALNDIDYLHFQGTVLGFNYHTNMDRWRLHLGVLRPGFILRDGGPHALFGHDFGIENYIDEKWYYGAKIGVDYKADSKIWGEDTHTVWYLRLKFGIIL